MTGSSAPRPSRTSLQVPMWRAVAVFRLAALAYATTLGLVNRDDYAHPHAAWPVLAGMGGWTAFTWYAYARPAWRRWPLLLADLAVSTAVVLASPWVIGRASLSTGTPTLAVAWLAGPVLTWAVSGGRRRGLVAAIVLGAAELSARGQIKQSSLTGVMLMILAAVAVGHVARLTVEAENRLQRATELEAATRERERLARGIHDSVLQVLAMVQRRGAQLDGEAGELARLAGEQEAALRALVTTGATAAAPVPAAGTREVVDLRTVLSRYAGAAVSVATPAQPVPLPAGVAEELGAAVGAALANVAAHCGPEARAWVLVEDEPDLAPDGSVTVTVRDNGPGIPEGRLSQAAAQGRLGVAQSIRGRLSDLGGTTRITSASGEGTEVELRVPRPPARTGPPDPPYPTALGFPA